MSSIRTPKPFLKLRVDDLSAKLSMCAYCAGYEDGRWRYSQLARCAMRWLPEFALRYDEYAELDASEAIDKTGEAALSVYQTTNFKSRGELGEILLHMIIRERFSTVPAISKIYFKDSPNVTVKGFDCVHVRVEDDRFELWLGEAKLYKSFERAIAAAVRDVAEHVREGYLRREFAAIVRKIDPAWPHAGRLRELLDKDRSLDEIFDAICIPVFIAYNSEAVAGHTSVTAAYKQAFEEEVRRHHKAFQRKDLPSHVVIRLLLLPLHTRAALVADFDRRLKACQSALT